jgi:hypothetical protein
MTEALAEAVEDLPHSDHRHTYGNHDHHRAITPCKWRIVDRFSEARIDQDTVQGEVDNRQGESEQAAKVRSARHATGREGRDRCRFS